MTNLIDPKRIRVDLDTQSRLSLNEEVVREYMDAMTNGETFPPLLVFYDESNDQYILADGFHRYAAHIRLKPDAMIQVEQRLGTVVDARWASIGANKSHGLQRSNDDKRNAVKQALIHPNGAKLSNNKIAEHVGVNNKTVAAIRRDLELSMEIPQIENRTVNRGNQTYTQNTNHRRQNNTPSENLSMEIPQIENHTGQNNTQSENLSSKISRIENHTGQNNTQSKNLSSKISRIENHTGQNNTQSENLSSKISRIENSQSLQSCNYCRYYADADCCCMVDDSKRMPWDLACEEFAIRVVEKSRNAIPAADYNNIELCNDKPNKQHGFNPHPKRKLKNCITVNLPCDNPQLFAIELREHYEHAYLAQCLTALKHLLDDEE